MMKICSDASIRACLFTVLILGTVPLDAWTALGGTPPEFAASGSAAVVEASCTSQVAGKHDWHALPCGSASDSVLPATVDLGFVPVGRFLAGSEIGSDRQFPALGPDPPGTFRTI
jgi:hypothetical protein